jgi:hypothetical protein
MPPPKNRKPEYYAAKKHAFAYFNRRKANGKDGLAALTAFISSSAKAADPTADPSAAAAAAPNPKKAAEAFSDAASAAAARTVQLLAPPKEIEKEYYQWLREEYRLEKDDVRSIRNAIYQAGRGRKVAMATKAVAAANGAKQRRPVDRASFSDYAPLASKKKISGETNGICTPFASSDNATRNR